MTVKSKAIGKKPASKRSTFTRKDTVTDTAKKAKAVKVVDVDMAEIERKAVERYQRKHGKGLVGKYGEPPVKPTRAIKGKGADVLTGTAKSPIKRGQLVDDSHFDDTEPVAYVLRHSFNAAVRASLSAVSNPRAFRPLNYRELGKLSAELIKLNPHGGPRIPAHHPLADAWNASQAKVSYENMQGGFCVCIVMLSIVRCKRSSSGPDICETVLWRGASRRSYKDKPNDVKGQLQAFERAVLYSRAERVPV